MVNKYYLLYMLVSVTSILLKLEKTSANGDLYHGYSVLRVIPETVDQLSVLIRLNELINNEFVIDYWREPSSLHVPVDVMTSNPEILKIQLELNGLSATVLIHDVQRFLDEKKELLSRNKKGKKLMDDSFTSTYHTNEEIFAYLSDLASRNSTPFVQLDRIGTTFEGREILNVRISSEMSSISSKPAIYLECGMHAREWVGHATCIWIIDGLTLLYGINSEITGLVDRFDWYITPVSNPDGYEYTWNSDRLWRKNRRPNDPNSPCMGVDPNRNFDANFGGIGSSSDPCSNTYSGEFAFSEPESKSMRDVLITIQGRLKAVVSIHNDAQMWISSYGFTLDRPVDYAEMERIMIIGTDAIRATYGQNFTYGPASEIIYFTSGTTNDYVYDSLGIVHAYTIELRNTQDGFVTPESAIAPLATEAWNGLKAMANALRI